MIFQKLSFISVPKNSQSQIDRQSSRKNTVATIRTLDFLKYFLSLILYHYKYRQWH